MGAETKGWGTGCRLDGCGGRRVVGMGVGDQQVGDSLSFHGPENGLYVVVVGRSGIDNGHLIRVPGRSDDEGARPVVGEHRRVVGYHASDEWRELLNIPVGGRILELELGWHGRILPDEPHWGEPRKTLGSASG